MCMWKNKKVLVAGGEGFIGKNLALKLRSLGANVSITTHASHHNNTALHDGEFYNMPCDLLDKSQCEWVTHKQDYVFMCAAVTHGAKAMKEDPMSMLVPSTIINTLMIDAAYKNNVEKFIFISSSVVYPDLGITPVKEEDTTNSEPPEIYYHLGYMKKYAEALCRSYHKLGKTKYNVIRPANIFGPYDDFQPETSHMAAALIKKVAERQTPFEIWGNGEDIRDILYIDDLINGIILTAEKINDFQPINISYGKGYSVKEILESLFDIESFYPKVIFNTNKPSMLKTRYIDNSLAKKLLGFVPENDIHFALAKTLEWYKNDNN